MLQKKASHKNKNTPYNIADNPAHASILHAQKIEEIRNKQRMEGNFDCFGKAYSGYCDQVNCSYHADCPGISQSILNKQTS